MIDRFKLHISRILYQVTYICHGNWPFTKNRTTMRVDVDDAVGKCCFQDVYVDYSVQQSNLLGSAIIDSKYVLRRTLHSEVRGVRSIVLRLADSYRMATGQPVLHCGGGFNCETLTLLVIRDKRQGRYRGNEQSPHWPMFTNNEQSTRTRTRTNAKGFAAPV